MGVGQILVLWLGIMVATVFPILLVLWVVYLICEPRERKRKARAAEREMIQARLDAEDYAWLVTYGVRSREPTQAQRLERARRDREAWRRRAAERDRRFGWY